MTTERIETTTEDFLVSDHREGPWGIADDKFFRQKYLKGGEFYMKHKNHDEATKLKPDTSGRQIFGFVAVEED